MTAHIININENVKCKRCGQRGATDNGLCLKCIADNIGKDKKAPAVAKLPDHVVGQLIQLADSGDAQWKQAARVLDQIFEDARAEGIRLPKMVIYQDAAAYLGQKLSTVRNWTAIYHAVGDALLDQYCDTFRFSHWRAMIPAARSADPPKSIEDFAAELAATSDDYGGLPIPVDVIIARTAKPEQASAEIFDEALDNARAALATMVRRIDDVNKKLHHDVFAISSALENLAARIEESKVK